MQKANIIETDLDFGKLYARECTDMLVIHHTGNAVDDDMSARQIHRSHKNNGWTGIGYHYVVRKDGSIERGRPHWSVGAHAYGENWHTIGIHVCGNFELVEPSQSQVEVLAMLIGTVADVYGLEITDKVMVPHGILMPTACPGSNLASMLRIIRGKAIWYQHN